MNQLTQYEPLTFDHPDFAGLPSDAERIAAVCRQLVRLSMDFAAIGRAPRYCPERKENNAEHSFMLSLVATELARQFRPDLDPGLVAQLSLVHDLPEIPAGKDTPTFLLDEAAVETKAKQEAEDTLELVPTLPPYIGKLLVRYEAQIEPESRFVRMTDKKLPVTVDLLGQGKQVMAEEYNIHTSEQLAVSEENLSRRLRHMFPDPDLAPLHAARDIIAKEFAASFAIS